MKLTKYVSIAATSLALTAAAVNAKPAEAASIKFLGQQAGNPNQYNYGVFADAPNEKLGALSSLTLSQLSGVTGVNAPSAFAVVKNTLDTVFLLIGSSQTASVNNEFTALKFSVLSSFTKPGPAHFAVVNSIDASGTVSGNTTGPSEDVPEPITVGGSLLAVGIAAWMKRKKAELAQQA